MRKKKEDLLVLFFGGVFVDFIEALIGPIYFLENVNSRPGDARHAENLERNHINGHKPRA